MEAQINLSELLTGHSRAELTGSGDVEIAGIEYDSRQVKPNSLFVAIKGYERDGFEFVPQAVERGAVAVVGDHDECNLVDNYVKVADTRQALADLSPLDAMNLLRTRLKNPGVHFKWQSPKHPRKGRTQKSKKNAKPPLFHLATLRQ